VGADAGRCGSGPLASGTTPAAASNHDIVNVIMLLLSLVAIQIIGVEGSSSAAAGAQAGAA
jgi:hypothetical protein